jgi:FtsH-binding integral membrane protein
MRELPVIELFFLTAFLSMPTYRIGRFIVLDTLIDEPRDKTYAWLELRTSLFWKKVVDLLGCPWCITIWVAAAVVAVADAFVSVPLPVFTWLAVATGSLVWWAIIDSD